MFLLKHKLKKASSGFSLVEIIMEMTLLITVTVPLVMMLNVQQEQINRNQANSANQALTNQLFANVDVQNPMLYKAYTVTTNTPILCDPAARNKDWAYLNNTCTNSTQPDFGKGPFFRRSINYVNLGTDKAASITVSLYRTSTATVPYYQVNREYNLDTFRMDYGIGTTFYPNYVDTSTLALWSNALFYTSYYSGVDDSGGTWAPAFTNYTTQPTGADIPLSYYLEVSGTCTPTTATVSDALLTPKAPFDNYTTISSSNCANGISSWFTQVVPGATYDVNAYLMIPAGTTTTYGCLSNTTGVSCQMADITIEAVDSSNASLATLKTYRNFDINSAASLAAAHATTKITVLQSKVVLPASTAKIKVTIKPTTPNTGTTLVNLAGLEVVRRTEQ